MGTKSLYKEYREFCRTKMIDMSDVCQRHLRKGNPIYYSEPGLPDNQLIKKYPDGRREVREFDGKCREGQLIRIL